MSVPESLREEYPFESKQWVCPAGNISYVDEGQGRAVVMLHGNPTWSWFYRSVIKALRGRYRCIVPDHLGCGLSDKPQQADYTLAGHIGRVQGILEQEGITEFDLIVHDWGGAIGFGLLRHWPQAVGKIVVLNTAAWREQMPYWGIAACRAPGVGALLTRGLNAFVLGAAAKAAVKGLSAVAKQGFVMPYDNWANRVAIHRFVQDIPMEPSHVSYEELVAIEESLGQHQGRPMLVCWGKQDFCFDDRFLAGWQQRFPEAHFCEYADAGHYLLEDEGEAINAEIVRFLGEG